MRSWLSVLITDAESKKVFDIPIAPSLYSLSNKMDNSLLAVRDINHKYIVVEGSSRGIFTGIIGWCDENGDGDWAIAIRGAEIDKDSIFIRAGAGIVQKSVAQEELEETEIKFRTMLRGLNLGEI